MTLRRGHFHLKEEALDRTRWRSRFGRGFGPVVRQTTKWMNEAKQTRSPLLKQTVSELADVFTVTDINNTHLVRSTDPILRFVFILMGTISQNHSHSATS